MRKLRSTLVEHGLFADLATDFTDIALGCIYQFTSTELAYIVPSDELRMEPGPRKYTDQSGKLVERQRLKHVPALLAGALARRLGVGEDVVQALWTTVGQHDDHCAAAFHQVVQRATTDPVLRPFTQALVERWGLEQAANC